MESSSSGKFISGDGDCQIESVDIESGVRRSETEWSNHEQEAEVRGRDEGLAPRSWVLVVPGASPAPYIPDLYFVWKLNISLNSTS